MFIKSKIFRDTAILTVMQLFLDTAALLLNVFITKQLGTSAIGILALMGSFLVLAGTISNGNAFLCTSRLISEELGKKDSNPNGVLFHGVKFCVILSIAVSAILLLFAEPFSRRFFSGVQMASTIRLMPAALISGAISGCLKGYFNASRKASVAAAGDIMEFTVKSAVIIIMTLAAENPDEGTVCGIMIGSIIAGNIFSLIYFLTAYIKLHKRYTGKCSLSFRQYASFAFPIMGGGILTSVLSSTNDALIPMCLRQYGNSVSEALSRFGIFEAIVIPTLFFPSVVLCSMSGIIVSESARAAAAGNAERIKSIASRLIEWTLMYAIISAAVLIRFGDLIGELLGGGELAGRMITVIAPVVPFIYMEIVLEALIKGMGQQAFSSLNYLAEYVIRISVVLILVPRIGFYGIVASYYASNVIGNCSRFIKLLRTTGMEFRPLKLVFLPILYSYLTMNAAELFTNIAASEGKNIITMVVMTVLWVLGYFGIYGALCKIRLFDIKRELNLFKINNNRA